MKFYWAHYLHKPFNSQQVSEKNISSKRKETCFNSYVRSQLRTLQRLVKLKQASTLNQPSANI